MKKALLGFLLCTLFACQKAAPDLLIPEEKLIAILADTHLAEAAIQNLFKEVKDSMGEVYYQQICEIHEVSKADFEQTMSQLREDPLRLEQLYRQVMEKLSTENLENK